MNKCVYQWSNKGYKKLLPSLKDLELVRGRIEEVGNRKEECLK